MDEKPKKLIPQQKKRAKNEAIRDKLPPKDPDSRNDVAPHTYKLTPAVQRAVVRAVQAGAPNYLVAAYAGISRETLARYEADIPSFAEAIAQARADVSLEYLEMINRAAPTEWRAAQWLYERIHGRSRYTDESEVGGDAGEAPRLVGTQTLAQAIGESADANRALHALLGSGAVGALLARGSGDGPQSGAVEAGEAPAGAKPAPRRRRVRPD